MKIAITGGSGGIGRAVAKMALADSHSVVSIDRVEPIERVPGVTYVFGEVADYDLLARSFAGCDAVVHMAAIPAPFHHPDHVVHNNNVVGSYNAMRAAIENGIVRICQASSVNAIGLSYSREPRFDYFPVDEKHPNYTEEPYGLSKYICEQQADALARRYEDVRISSMRFHWVVPDRAMASEAFNAPGAGKHLWAYTLFEDAARACLLSVTTATFKGHEVFFIVAPDTTSEVPSVELAAQYFPQVPITGDLRDNNSFFSSHKAERLLGLRQKRGGAS